MDNNLLKKLGIAANLPADQLLEKLQDKNLEYLERIDACSDEKRLEELRGTQQQIEGMIMSLTTGMTLSRQVQTKTDAELADMQPDPAADTEVSAPSTATYNDALIAFQRGDYQTALPVLQGYAEKGDVQACLLTAHMLSQQGEDEATKRYLFVAAKQGEDTATFMLAQQYFREDNYISAEKWARTLYDKQFPGSGALLTSILLLEGLKPEAMSPMINELKWLQGYERYEQTKYICDYVDNCFKQSEKVEIVNDLRRAVNADELCMKLVYSRYGALETERAKASIKLSAPLVGVIGAILSCYIAETSYDSQTALIVYVVFLAINIIVNSLVFFSTTRGQKGVGKGLLKGHLISSVILSAIFVFIVIRMVNAGADMLVYWGLAGASCSGLLSWLCWGVLPI